VVGKLKELTALMGDLGLPGSVVEMPEVRAQKDLWEVRKAGLNIMMSLKGDGKPVSFIEDCAVPLEHLAAYTDALTEVFGSMDARHVVRARLGWHLHVRPILDMRRGGPEGGVAKMRAIAEEASRCVRKFRGAYSGEHGEWAVQRRMDRVAVRGRNSTTPCARSSQHLDPVGLFKSGEDH